MLDGADPNAYGGTERSLARFKNVSRKFGIMNDLALQVIEFNPLAARHFRTGIQREKQICSGMIHIH